MKIKITCRPRYNPWLKKYLNTKIFSRILTLVILLNNISINSFAERLSEDNRYEVFEGNDIIIDNVLEEDRVNVEIEGNTLINLFDINNYNTYMYPNKMTLTGNKLRVNYEPSDAIGNISPIGKDNRNILKNNTTYTMIVNIEGQATGSIFGKAIPANARGVNKFVFTYNELAKADCYRLWLGSNTEIVDFSIEFLMLLEGDWTNKELPGYFKGMKSAGQDDENGHKIKLSSNGVNILDKKLFKRVENNGVVNYIIEEELKGSCFERDINYYFKRDNGEKVQCLFYYLDENRRYIQAEYFYSAGTKYTIKKRVPNAKYYTIIIRPFGNQSIYNSNVDDFFNNNYDIRVSTDTWHEYKPYQEVDKKEFLLNEPLRGLSNGVKDKIIKKNGKWTIEKNCKELAFDGSEDERWQKYASYGHGDDGNTHLFRLRVNDNIYGTNSILYCDKMYTDYGNKYNYNKEMIYLYNEYIYVHVFAKNLDTIDVTGFRQYLQQNPITVMYQLATPIYKSAKTDLNVQLFESKTYISNNSTIPVNMKITVDRVLNRAVEYTELAKTTPTTENLSKARYWNNLLKDSIKKDVLQEEVDNITSISDMVLDLKTATSNFDVYIKSENALSISLDTNNITLSDFSGVEDIENINAVNVTISSTLPYQLNAYLPSEIENADKSAVMDKRILNIRENSQSDYQYFQNINEKMVLKDNCVSGNDIEHGLDIKLKGGIFHKKDVYKAVIKLEAEQK